MEATKHEDDSDLEAEQDGKDPTLSGRDAAIFLIELSPEMFEKTDEDSHFQLALQCARSMNVNKIVSSSSDYVGVVLFGTDRQGEPSPTVHVLQQLDLPDAKRIIQLDEHMSGDMAKFRNELGISTSYSLADALSQCGKMFSSTNKTSKLHSKRVLLFTCRDRPPDAASEAARGRAFTAVQDLRDSDATVDLFPLGEGFSMEHFYQEILCDSSGDEPPPTAVVTSRLDELLTRVRQKSHKKRSVGKIPFALGDGVKVAVGVYNLIRTTSKPASVRLEQTSNEQVTALTSEVTESGDTLLRSEINYCLNYGDTNIALNSDEVRELPAICDPGLVLLGFRPISQLQPLLHVQPASFIYPEDDWIKGSSRLFAALLERCAARQVAAVCRLVARRSDPPHLVTLVPQRELTEDGSQTAPPGFHLLYLPFADDIRQLSLPSPSRASDAQIETARNIVMKLRFKYAPEKIENPVLQKHWINIEALALGRDQPEEFVDYTAPDVERIERKAGDLMAQFKSLVFPDGQPEGAPTAAKRARLDPDQVDVAALAKNKQVERATVGILREFLKSVGAGATGKKADLVKAVYDHFDP